ncbi:MAG: hypothetical protein K8E24_002990 [Methanobacterium paludis]|nr:hypothetical protein [Methanobacterium paludis]
MSESPFTIIVSHIEEFKSFLNMLLKTHHFDEDFQVHITEEGVKIRELDCAHITFLDLLFPPKFFYRYECQEPTVLKLNTYRLLWILDAFDTSEVMIFQMNGEKLEVRSNAMLRRKFEISQEDIKYEPPSLPKIDYPINLCVTFKDFLKVLKDNEGSEGNRSSEYSHQLRLKYYDKSLFSTSRNGDYEACIRVRDSKECTEEHNAIYDLCKFKPLFQLAENKFIESCMDDIFIQFGQDTPIIIKSIPTEADPSFKMMIAQRIEVDD